MADPLQATAETVDGVIAEFLMEMESGAGSDLETLIQKYPEHAERIRDYFRRSASLEAAFGFGAAAEVPLQIPDYEVQATIGRGGMGVVYRAKQISLNRPVAIKVARDGVFASSDQRERFLREAQAAARLQHPNIVPVYEVGDHDGVPYMVQALAIGTPLSSMLEQGPVPEQLAAGMILNIAHAIEYSHQSGIIHRDIKPANIIVSVDDKPLVTDFGLARMEEDESDQLTKTGDVLGTPAYLPPEVLRGSRGDARADIYSLGATLFQMLTGRPPFQGASLAETVQLALKSDPIAPRKLLPTLSEDLESICLKCLNPEPSERYESCALVANDLQRFLDGRPTIARPIGVFEKTKRWAKRNPRVATLSVVSSVALIGLVLTSVAFAVTISGKNDELQNTITDRDTALTEANENLALVREAAYESFTRIAKSALRDTPGSHALRRELLEDAVKFHRELVGSGKSATVSDLGIANRELAEMELQLGNLTQASDFIAEAQRILTGSPDNQLELARARRVHGQILQQQSKLTESAAKLEVAVGTLSNMESSQERDLLLASTYETLARTNRAHNNNDQWLANVEEGISVARNRLALSPSQETGLLLAKLLLARGAHAILHYKPGESRSKDANVCPRADRAAKFWGEAYEICEQLLQTDKDNAEIIDLRANAMANYGCALGHIDSTRKRGIQLQREAAEVARRKFIEYPEAPKFAEAYIDRLLMVADSVQGTRTDCQKQNLPSARSEYTNLIRCCEQYLKGRPSHRIAYLQGVFKATAALASLDGRKGDYQTVLKRITRVLEETKAVPEQLETAYSDLLTLSASAYANMNDKENACKQMELAFPLVRKAGIKGHRLAEVTWLFQLYPQKTAYALETMRLDEVRSTLKLWDRDTLRISKMERDGRFDKIVAYSKENLAVYQELLDCYEAATAL